MRAHVLRNAEQVLPRLLDAGKLPKRQRYRLRDVDVARIQIANRKDLHPVMVQGRVNAAWCEIARELGFDAYTVEPVDPGSSLVFTAIPLPNDDRNGGMIVLPEPGR